MDQNKQNAGGLPAPAQSLAEQDAELQRQIEAEEAAAKRAAQSAIDAEAEAQAQRDAQDAEIISQAESRRRVEAALAGTVATPAPRRIRSSAFDVDRQVEKLAKIWSRDAPKNDRPPTTLAAKSFKVRVTPVSGQEIDIMVDNCADESDAKRAAYAHLGIHPRDAKATVERVA